ncbi:MAG: type II toxin-antitoxin system RelE/ParE family toxin [Bacteroidota bacterium]|nr:type II toxin-antitoxin system RelE/ParE family toxin [Bacteroidota bacterium]
MSNAASPKFRVQFLEEAVDFLESLDEKARDKVIYNINKAGYSNDKELFKKLTDEIWEFRTLFNKVQYRLFAFWDKTDKKDTIVISTHGLVKKTGKTPQADLDRAERLRKLYFELKGQNK